MITWVALRASGVGAYLMLFASVAWGIAATTSIFGRRVPKATAVAVHHYLSTVSLALLGLHIGGLLVDRFVEFDPLDAVVPFLSPYRPAAVALGILATYMMAVVLLSSWLRSRIGTAWWRRLHLLAAPSFALSLAHGLLAGSDTGRPWMWWIYMATGATVAFLLFFSAWHRGTAQRRPTPGAGASLGVRAGSS